MIFEPTRIAGAWVIELERIGDERGFFARAWDRDEANRHGIDAHIAQMNLSRTHRSGTFRGFHWNPAPHGEAKTVRCVTGSVFDVIVDMRTDSPTYRQWFGIELSAANLKVLHLPEGVANGFLITADETTLLYSTNRPYEPGVERGIRYDDPALDIDWPIPVETVSDKDRAWPLLP